MKTTLLKQCLYLFVAIILISGCSSDSSETSPETSSGGMQALYPYIPTDSNLTDAMAYRFLNMATFGATPASVDDLRSKGVVKWLDDQLNMEYDYESQSVLIKHMKMALHVNPGDYNTSSQGGTNYTIEQYLADNDINFYHYDKKKRRGLKWHMSSLFDGHMADEQQVRQRIAYALSQIVVASQSNDEFFYMRAEALSHYYDFLMKHAFGNYGDVLYDVSMTSAMSVFLTYEGNKKEHIVEGPEANVTVTPDENYGRELMQLFSIGLFNMNMDGTINYRNGEPIPTYEQEDVNEMSRVFTGLWSKGGQATFGDGISLFGNMKKRRANTIQPLTCDTKWHDSENKTVLGKPIAGSDDCSAEVKSAVELLKSHQNMSPFISKKLILRLTKSNPEADYVYRVATVFEDNGSGVKGDLKEVTRAIFLDPELWEDLVDGDATKMKEPYLKLTGLLRAFDAEPASHWRFKLGRDNSVMATKPFYYMTADTLYQAIGQAPTFSPTVFNFYSDSYEPNLPEFKNRSYVAPEVDIQTMTYVINFSNYLNRYIIPLEKSNIHAVVELNPDKYGDNLSEKEAEEAYFYGLGFENSDPKFMMNKRELYDLLETRVGDTLGTIPRASADQDLYEDMTVIATDWIAIRLLGKKLRPEIRTKVINNFKNVDLKISSDADAVHKLSRYLINPLVRVIVDSATYSVIPMGIILLYL